jgi:hypothetical protein
MLGSTRAVAALQASRPSTRKPKHPTAIARLEAWGTAFACADPDRVRAS